MKEVNILLVGDIVGQSGMSTMFLSLSSLVKKWKADFVVVNGENAADGYGLTDANYYDLKKYGADVITSGNHIWQQQEIFPLLDSKDDLLRPYNYPKGAPGHGYVTVEKNGVVYSVVNLQGRVEMHNTDCPFVNGLELCKKLAKVSDFVIVDCHAERSEEKEALAFYLDGYVNIFVGTHTHVQTMDEKILPKGCAYLTDLGHTGSQNGVIGSDAENSIKRQLTGIPFKTVIGEDDCEIKGLIVKLDKDTKKVISLERI